MKTLKKLKLSAFKPIFGIHKNVLRFQLGEKLQTRIDKLTHLEGLLSLETKKLKKQHDLYKTNLEGLKAFEEKLFDKKLNGQADQVISSILKEEIKHLMDTVTIQQEVINKSHFSTSELSQLKKPKAATARYPLDKIKSYLELRKNTKDFETQITDKGVMTVDTDGAANYKSEHLKVADTYVTVGDKLKRIYYLADIPAFLSPYVFFKLLTSDLPFTISIFIEPATSAELLKKAKQRLSVLEMQQNERLRDGKVRDQTRVDPIVKTVNGVF